MGKCNSARWIRRAAVLTLGICLGCVSKQEFLDADGDGHSGAEDCDESNDKRYVGAHEEPRNGIDDNCDGRADEPTDDNDWDGDGFTVLTGDCNDQNAAIHPGAKEECDGVDNNCNGKKDDEDESLDTGGGCPSGLPGACATGTQRCVGGTLLCEPPVKPADMAKEDLCNGVDDDCDGSLDEGCQCLDGTTQPCGLTLGECGKTPGQQLCTSGVWGECQNPPAPQVETCNGLDDDCNGNPDDAPALLCHPKTACAVSIPACANGTDNACPPLVANQEPEVCDEIDNNCDGQVDEGCLCKPGETQVCPGPSGLKWSDLDPADPDYAAGSACKKGSQTCLPSGQWGPCSAQVLPQPLACNGKDNDCNGTIDANQGGLDCDCTDGATEPCGTALPECQGPITQGSRVCSGGKWGSCLGATCEARVTFNQINLLPYPNKNDDFGGAALVKLNGVVSRTPSQVSIQVCVEMNGPDTDAFACGSSSVLVQNVGFSPVAETSFAFVSDQDTPNDTGDVFFVVPDKYPSTNLVKSILCQGDTSNQDFGQSGPGDSFCNVSLGYTLVVIVLPS